METSLDIVIDPSKAQQGAAAVKRALDDVKQSARGAQASVSDFAQQQLALLRQEVARMAPQASAAAQATGSIGSASASALPLVAGLTSGLVVAGGVILKAATYTANYAQEIVNASQQTTVATNEIQGLKYMAEQTGSSLPALARALKNLNDNMTETVNGTGDGARLFKALGVEVTDTTGRMRPTLDVAKDVADRFAAMRNEAAKVTLANKLLGESGSDMLRIMNLGGSGIQAYIDEHRRLGKVLTEEELGAALQFNNELGKLKLRFQDLAITVGSQAIPSLNQWLDRLERGINLLTSPVGRAFLQVMGGGLTANLGAGAASLFPNAPGSGGAGPGGSGGGSSGSPGTGGGQEPPQLPNIAALVAMEKERYRSAEELRKQELDNLRSWSDLKRLTVKQKLNEETGDQVEQAAALRQILLLEFEDVKQSFAERRRAIVAHYAQLKDLAAGNKTETVKVENEKQAALSKLEAERVQAYVKQEGALRQANEATTKAREQAAAEYWEFITRLEIENRERERRLTIQSAEFELQSFQGTLAERRTLLDQSQTLARAIIQRDLQRRELDEEQATRLLTDLQREQTSAAIRAVKEELAATNQLTQVKVEQATSEEERRAARNAGLLREQQLLTQQGALLKQIDINRVQGQIQMDQASETVRQRQLSGTVAVAQAELVAAQAGYASFEELAARRMTLLQAQYEREINQVNLTEKEKLAIRIRYSAQLRQQTQLAEGGVLEIYKYGLQEYLTNTGNTFNIAVDMARETANAMSSGFKTFFVDRLKAQALDIKSILTGVRDFAYNVIGEVAARLATAGLLRMIAGTAIGQYFQTPTTTPTTSSAPTQNVGLERFGGIFPPVQQYDAGGIARRPQMAIFGEGSQSEAFVPLPDGRSIPVTLRMPRTAPAATAMQPVVNQVSIEVFNEHKTASVQAAQRRGPDGRLMIRMLVRETTLDLMRNGDLDRDMESIWGLQRQGRR